MIDEEYCFPGTRNADVEDSYPAKKKVDNGGRMDQLLSGFRCRQNSCSTCSRWKYITPGRNKHTQGTLKLADKSK